MSDSYLTDAELTFLRELGRLKVEFMVVGMAAAIVQGSDRSTEDVDLWFSSLSDPGIDEAARAAGGTFAWRANPPVISGKDLNNIDLVWKLDGLRSFKTEYAGAIDAEIFGVAVKVLPIERVVVSKRAASRQKDKVAIPSLEATLVAIRAGRKSPR